MAKRHRRGQSTAEYAIVIGVVVGAAVAMQLLIKRGWQAKVKAAVDSFTAISGGPNSLVLSGEQMLQYEPYYADQSYNVTQNRVSNEKITTGGRASRTLTKSDTTRTGSSRQGTQLNADALWVNATRNGTVAQ